MSLLLRFRRHVVWGCALTLGAGLAPGLSAQVSANAAQTTQPSNDPVTISGQVVNAVSGQPVPRALVRFNDRAMLTNHDGNFEFDQVTDGTGTLQVIKPGFYASLDPGGVAGISLRANEVVHPVELRLYPESIFTGTVTAPDGEPLPHILVSARRSIFDEGGHRWAPVAQDQTDSRGRFRLPVQAGEYRLETMYISGSRQSGQIILPVIVPSGNSSNSLGFVRIRSGEELSFDLHPATSRAYTVTATFDSSLSRGFPRLVARSSNGVTIPLSVNGGRSRSPGGTRFELPAGTYTLTADVMSADGAEQAEATVTITDHDVSGVVFHLAPVPTLPVELQIDGAATTDSSQPSLQQFGLTLENVESNSDVLNSTLHLAPRRDRTVAFTVPPGTYRLRASGNGAWYVKSASYGASDLLQEDLVIGPGAGGTPIRIAASNQIGSLQGTCKLGSVPAACTVYLIAMSPSAKPIYVMRGNAQGAYNDASVPPGSYQAIAFEQRHSADYGDPATLAPFASHVRSVTINAGDKPTLDLDTVSTAEMLP
jgi:hypothetical protein